eukprot:TRINITY_DN8480_c0_g1_i1.p1 TRINITY_DN8480_c0_g1~~TRINITY_DN8480_c0_g1_i1.p1  ORF type:complete len:318 (-),score=84.93 TRINITY_DN8480_c0_g1_i1:19-972(-)
MISVSVKCALLPKFFLDINPEEKGVIVKEKIKEHLSQYGLYVPPSCELVKEGLSLDDDLPVGEQTVLFSGCQFLFFYQLDSAIDDDDMEDVVNRDEQLLKWIKATVEANSKRVETNPLTNEVNTMIDAMVSEFRNSEDPFFLPDLPAIGGAISALTDMGFPESRAKKALLLNMLDPGNATMWLLENMDSPTVDDPLTDIQIELISENFRAYFRESLGLGEEPEIPKPDAPPISELITLCHENNICTYSVTGAEFTSQQWVYCYTCGLVATEGVCLSCAKICHKGHRLSEPRPLSSFFCDCGHNSQCCQALAFPEEEQ